MKHIKLFEEYDWTIEEKTHKDIKSEIEYSFLTNFLSEDDFLINF